MGLRFRLAGFTGTSSLEVRRVQLDHHLRETLRQSERRNVGIRLASLQLEWPEIQD